MITIPELMAFDASCSTVGVQTPAPVMRALDLHEAAQQLLQPQPLQLLELEQDQLQTVLTEMSLRQHTGVSSDQVGLTAGMPVFERQLIAEVITATLPLLDGLIEELQPRFDAGAARISEAARRGFTSYTSAAQVLERRNADDAEAFMAARDEIAALQPIVSFRQTISRVFSVAPAGPAVDFSVTFAAGDNWSESGEYNRDRKHPGLVDLVALAAGGLRLNTVTEVQDKLTARRFGEIVEQRSEESSVVQVSESSWSDEQLSAAVEAELARQLTEGA